LTQFGVPFLKEPLTIVHLLPHFASQGNGVVNAVVDVASEQSSAGYRIACIGHRGGSFVELLESRSVTTHVLEESNLNPLTVIRNFFRLYALLRNLNCQIVHAHTIPSALLAKLLQPLFDYGLVTTVHNGHRLRNYLLGVGDVIICVSLAVSLRMKRLFGSRLEVVRNGPLGSPRRPPKGNFAPALKISRPAIVTMAGLGEHKGIQDLIEGFEIARRSIPGLSLYILGEGPMRSRLEEQVARIKCEDCVHFEGYVEDPREYLAQADVFVLASHREAFGLALAEAREAGCAVVGTDVGGIPEVLEYGRAGMLVPAKDPKRIGQVLTDLFTDQAGLEAWQRRSLDNLSWLHVQRMCKETLDVYAKLLNSKDRQLSMFDVSPRLAPHTSSSWTKAHHETTSPHVKADNPAPNSRIIIH
jgi:glycosyltransferase involved in cell wall biosynthesis